MFMNTEKAIVRKTETIAPLPTRQIINNKNGKGSYVSGEMYKERTSYQHLLMKKL